MQSMFLEGFTAPFCSLISHLLAFTNQKAPWCPKRAQYTWKKARWSVLISSSAVFLITYFQLQSSIFTSKAEKGLSVILCTFYPLEHNHYSHKKQLPGYGPSVPPRLVTWQMTSESGGSPWAKDLIFFRPRMELQLCRAHGWHDSEQS